MLRPGAARPPLPCEAMSGSSRGTPGAAPVRGVLLDVGGVMLVPDPDAIAEVTRRFGGGAIADRIIRAHYAAMATADDGLAFSWPTYHHHLAAGCAVPRTGLGDATMALQAAFASTNLWRTPLDGAREALRRLSGGGLRIAIVSNSDGTVEKALALAGVCQVGPGPGVEVDLIIDSHLVGAAKPDPAIFALALDALGMGADEVVHVGDTRFADIAGAEAAGILPLHLDPYDDCPQPDGHAHVQHLADVVDRVLPGAPPPPR